MAKTVTAAKEDPRFRGDDKNKALSISSLSLHHFRNYASVQLDIATPIIVLTGRNGAGKTNILEALSLLTPGRGLRRAKLAEIDNVTEHSAWAISARIHGMQGEAHIGTGRVEEENADKRLVKIDGKPRPQADLGKHLAMLWLTPQMEQLFLEGASAGRKFLDRLVYSFDPEHAARVNTYEYAMRERNKLLETGGDTAWLDSLEQAMAEGACAIARARLETISNINRTMQESTLSFPKAQLSVEGFCESRPDEETALKEALARGRGQDAAAGRALIGVHRSEFKVFHAEKTMPAERCSTGEQKALLLSIVLSQARATASQKSMIPLLLFDEIAAHLDSIRRLELFEEICQIGAQTWMTGTDEKIFADLKEKAHYFTVENGAIR